MQIKITSNDISGLNSIFAINSRAMVGAYSGMVESAGVVRLYIRRQLSMNAGKTGRYYYRPELGIVVRASGPGEYPAPITGALRNSIESEVTLDEVKIGSTLMQEYPSLLEDYMDRSYLRRGIEENTSQIEDIIGSSIYQSLIG